MTSDPAIRQRARFLGRRLAAAGFVLLAAVVIVVAIGETLHDPARIELGPFASPEALAQRRHELARDRPLGVRIVKQIIAAATGNWGTSVVHRRPVIEVLRSGLGPTLAYAVPGFVLASIAAAAAALHRVDRRRHVATSGFDIAAGMMLGLSSLIVVIALHDVFAHRLAWFPLLGWPLYEHASESLASYLVLPVLAWATMQWPADYRMYRSIFAGEVDAEHVTAMRARGLARATIRRHILRGSAGTIIARIVSRLPHLVVGSIVIEEVFNIPGLGDAMIVGSRSGDVNLLQGAVLLSAGVTVVAQLAGDLVAGRLDPRLRPDST